MLIDDIQPSQILNDPPELTEAIAKSRWREINILLHSIVLFGDELAGGKQLAPILRAAATLAASERALLFQCDDGDGRIRTTATLGFEKSPSAEDAGSLQADACLLHRKPILTAIPQPSGRENSLRAELERAGAKAALTVPLTHQGMPWGAIQVLRERPFKSDEAVLLWLFALVLEGVLPSVIGPRRHREMMTTVDPATGLLMPDQFKRRLAWEIHRSTWLARPMTVVCIEVTEMLHGRPRGSSMNLTPRKASIVIHRALRQNDSATCLGNQHFIAALPDTTRAEAEPIADLICDGLLSRAAGTLPVFDVMSGLATFPEEGRTEADLIRAACAAGRRQRRQLSRNPLVG